MKGDFFVNERTFGHFYVSFHNRVASIIDVSLNENATLDTSYWKMIQPSVTQNIHDYLYKEIELLNKHVFSLDNSLPIPVFDVKKIEENPEEIYLSFSFEGDDQTRSMFIFKQEELSYGVPVEFLAVKQWTKRSDWMTCLYEQVQSSLLESL
jgi:hypothetical protein